MQLVNQGLGRLRLASDGAELINVGPLGKLAQHLLIGCGQRCRLLACQPSGQSLLSPLDQGLHYEPGRRPRYPRQWTYEFRKRASVSGVAG